MIANKTSKPNATQPTEGVVRVALPRIVHSLWIMPAVILGIVIFLLALLAPLYLLACGLVTFIGCDPGLATLLAMAIGVPWSMLLPHILD